eukprot:gene1985-2442_t
MSILSKLPKATTDCSRFHPWSKSCTNSAAQVWTGVFVAGLKLYAPLFLISALVYKRKGTLPEILRSSVFLGTYGGVFAGSICLLRAILGRDSKSIAAMGGFLAGFSSILIERKERRSELALYCLNQALEIVWKMAAARGLAFYIKNGEVLVFMIASAILMYFYKQEPQCLRLTGLFQGFLKM